MLTIQSMISVGLKDNELTNFFVSNNISYTIHSQKFTLHKAIMFTFSSFLYKKLKCAIPS